MNSGSRNASDCQTRNAIAASVNSHSSASGGSFVRLAVSTACGRATIRCSSKRYFFTSAFSSENGLGPCPRGSAQGARLTRTNSSAGELPLHLERIVYRKRSKICALLHSATLLTNIGNSCFRAARAPHRRRALKAGVISAPPARGWPAAAWRSSRAAAGQTAAERPPQS
jgi:hypothetical protein